MGRGEAAFEVEVMSWRTGAWITIAVEVGTGTGAGAGGGAGVETGARAGTAAVAGTVARTGAGAGFEAGTESRAGAGAALGTCEDKILKMICLGSLKTDLSKSPTGGFFSIISSIIGIKCNKESITSVQTCLFNLFRIFR